MGDRHACVTPLLPVQQHGSSVASTLVWSRLGHVLFAPGLLCACVSGLVGVLASVVAYAAGRAST